MNMVGDPIGLPGLAVLAASSFLFLVALAAARMRAGSEARGNTTRSARSMAGIGVQAFAIGLAGFGRQNVSLDPLSVKALIEASACAALMAAAIGLFWWASATMGRNWSLVARTREDHQLVQTGPFAHIRHPIYTALFLTMIAIAIGCGHAAHLWFSVPLYALGTSLRIAEEERLLYARFGNAHDAYAARVKRFVPGLF